MGPEEDRRRRIIMMVLLVLIGVVALILAEHVDAHADVITGEIPLAGIGKALNDFYDRGGEIFDDDEVELLANVMWYENGCNGDYVMLLTGSVVLNRVACPWYPNTIQEVVYQKGQYATTPNYYTGEIPKSVYSLAKELLLGGSIAPSDVLFQAMFPQGRETWLKVKGEYFCR